MSLSDGSVTTLAGTLGVFGDADSTASGIAYFNHPCGLALSASGDTLFVADRDNDLIRSVDVFSGWVSTYAGSTNSSSSSTAPTPTIETGAIDRPIALTRVGRRLYIGGMDQAVHVLYMLTDVVSHAAGIVSSSPGGSVDGINGTAQFNQPSDFAPSEDGGAIYVADRHSSAVRKVLIPPSCNAAKPLNADFEHCTLSGIPGVSGSDDGAAGLATFSAPTLGLAWGEGWLYVSDTDNHMIRYVDTANGKTDFLYSDSVLNGPEGLALSGSSLYVADTLNHAIRTVDINYGDTLTLAGNLSSAGQADGNPGVAKFDSPSGLALLGAALYVSDKNNHAIRVVSTIDGWVTTLTGTLGVPGGVDGPPGTAMFSSPCGLVASTDTLYVADQSNHAIRAVDLSSGNVSTVAGFLGSPGAVDGALGTNRLTAPWAVALHGNSLYFSGDGHALRAVDMSTGSVATVAGALGSDEGEFSSPRGLLAVQSSLYVADAGNHVIREVKLPAHVCSVPGDVCTVTGVAGKDAYQDGPFGQAKIQYSEDMLISGTSLYFCGTDSCAIRIVNTLDGSISTLVPTADNGCGAADGDSDTAMLSEPASLALDGTSLYVSDFGNHAVTAQSDLRCLTMVRVS